MEASKKTVKGVRDYCFTLNNYTPEEEAKLDAMKCQYMIYGHEIAPTTGTPHLQGYVYFKEARTMTAILKEVPRLSLRECRGDDASNIVYCSKDATDVKERGVRPMNQAEKGKAGKRKYEDAIRLAEEDRIDEIDPSIRLRMLKNLKEIRNDAVAKRRRAEVQQPVIDLYPWQEVVLEILRSAPGDREIVFVHDPVGNAGKSTFVKWLRTSPEFQDKVQVFRPGKAADLSYMLDVTKSVFIIDIPRVTGEHMCWGFVESVKDGCVVSPKYDTREKVFPTPHVIIFCNTMPAEGSFSEDRIRTVKC